MDDGGVSSAGDTGSARAWTIRARRQDDIGACVGLLADVHAADGYPLYWPVDPPTWLTPDNLLAAWVAEDAEDAGAVLGHVALCGAIGETAAPVWSAAAGLAPERIAAVAKLFAAPSVRGRGFGAALLAAACAEARLRGLRPALEVLDHDRGAIALYERAGWQRVASAQTSWSLPHGGPVVLHCYIAPD